MTDALAATDEDPCPAPAPASRRPHVSVVQPRHPLAPFEVPRPAGLERIAVVCEYEPVLSETFIRMHIDELPAHVVIVGWRPSIDGRPVLSTPELAMYGARHKLFGGDRHAEATRAYVRAFRRLGITAVLAEYGPTAVQVLEACQRLRIRLVAHFHGYDASVGSVLQDQADGYRRLFEQAAAVVVVSEAMEARLLGLGADRSRVYLNPYGVDTNRYHPPAVRPWDGALLAVGRFVEKKAPQLTLAAFASVHREVRHARLRMIGDGPLLGACQDLAAGLGLRHAVDFLGAQPPEFVRDEMGKASIFVQHSLTASNGDSEGTPVSIIEAAASGLPVVATTHAGIPDVVIHGETGLLGPERDVPDMAASILRLLGHPELAHAMGSAGRARVLRHFDKGDRIMALRRIVTGAA